MKRPQKGRKNRQRSHRAAEADAQRRAAVIPAKLRGQGKKGAGLRRPDWMLR